MDWFIQFVIGIPAMTWLRSGLLVGMGSTILHVIHLRKRARFYLKEFMLLAKHGEERLNRERDWGLYKSFVACGGILLAFCMGVVATF